MLDFRFNSELLRFYQAMADEKTEGKMWVNEFLIAQGLTGLTQ